MYQSAGFDVVGDLLSLAVQYKIVEKSGAWYSYAGAKIGQGENNTVKHLKENPKVLNSIEAALGAFFNPQTAGELPIED